MSEYEEQLNTFSIGETRDQTKLYFEKYWLASNEYWEKWLPIQKSVFEENAKHLPDLMFRPNFELLPLIGGNIFTSEKDFESLKHCMRQTGDEYFVVVQNKDVVIKVYYGEHGEDDWRIHPLLRFIFPANISWAEMMSGGYISIELLQGATKDYFIFGNGGNWGRYVANDYVNRSIEPAASTPLNIMGFKEKFSELFRKNFEEVRRLESHITPENLLPDSYKQLHSSLG